MYSYDLVIADVDCAVGTALVRLTNYSPAAWERVEGVGELILGLRLTRPGASTAAVEGRKRLPERFAPGQTGEFEIRFDIDLLGAGCFWLDIGLLREGLEWVPQDRGAPARLQIVVAPQKPVTTASYGQVFGNDLEHPYRGRPPWSFWSTGVAALAGRALDPMISAPFTIGKSQRVATAGSCFAQNIAMHLRQAGFNFLCTEPDPDGGTSAFSAQYGNVYTAHQLRQLLHRAYGLLRPRDIAWERADGRFIDPFRPQLFPLGFSSEADVREERDRHLREVRRLFEQCQVFVFTLGLTETWINASDGVALPVPPGAVAIRAGDGPYVFRNYGSNEITDELRGFVADVRLVNPELRVILTVSPVPLVATYENQHVLVANTFSKSTLRVAAECVVKAEKDVAYFPSYEIVTSHASGGSYFESDFRNVSTDGVAHVMRVFQRHYMAEPADQPAWKAPSIAVPDKAPEWFPEREELTGIICDENLLEVK